MAWRDDQGLCIHPSKHSWKFLGRGQPGESIRDIAITRTTFIITLKMLELCKIHSYKERVWDQKGHSVLCSLKKGSNGFPILSPELSQIGKVLAMFSHSVWLLGTYILITQTDAPDCLGNSHYDHPPQSSCTDSMLNNNLIIM